MTSTTPPDACYRCGRDLDPDRNVFEAQEALRIDFLTGYASVFGDCNRVAGLFCQHCVQDLLGSYLQIEPPRGQQETGTC